MCKCCLPIWLLWIEQSLMPIYYILHQEYVWSFQYCAKGSTLKDIWYTFIMATYFIICNKHKLICHAIYFLPHTFLGWLSPFGNLATIISILSYSADFDKTCFWFKWLIKTLHPPFCHLIQGFECFVTFRVWGFPWEANSTSVFFIIKVRL